MELENIGIFAITMKYFAVMYVAGYILNFIDKIIADISNQEKACESELQFSLNQRYDLQLPFELANDFKDLIKK